MLGVAATWRVERARPLTWIFITYLLVCSAAFVFPSAVGENIARLRYMALPVAVLALSLRRWRPRLPAIALVLLAAVWNLTPLGWTVDRNVGDSAGTSAYWADTSAFLHARLTPNHRVEVVDTASHWASYYLAGQHLPLARGWYRQDDFPRNALLYSDLTAKRYLHWLHSLAVLYVVLPDVQLDYSAQAEAELLRGRANPLRPVARLRHVTVFAVPNARPLVTGPGEAAVVGMTQKTVEVSLSTPGRYRIAVRYSPYWRASRGCVSETADDAVALTVYTAGLVQTHTRRRPPEDARGARRARPRVPSSELMRRLRRGMVLLELAALPIAAGLTAALIVDNVTESGRYGLWVGSFVTVTMAAIIGRRRGG